jgi:Zn-finger nucleic acid-binding protein
VNCPRCQTTSLEELDRDGITIDRCTSCRGVWLDRGELERLTAREREVDNRRGGDDFDEDSDAGGGRRGRRGGFWNLFD